MDRLIITLGIISLLIISCEGEFEPTDLDGKVDLTFPENVQICPDGTPVGNDKIQLRLIWNSQTDFTKYRVTLKDSEGKIIHTNQVGKIKDTLVTLDRSTLYYWFVSGLRGKEVKPSDEWSFYTLGEAESGYIPYPATIQVNVTGENVSISWAGKDEDNNIKYYDVYLSTENPPTASLLEKTELTSTTQVLSTGVTYYVQVVTTDEENNSSNSQVISFTP